MRVCSVAGCPNIYDSRKTRCPQHEQQAERIHGKRTRAYNTKAHKQGFRAEVLRRDPICVICGLAQSTDADHHPRSRDQLEALGLDPNNPDYGRGLCHTCHSKATALNQPGGWHM